MKYHRLMGFALILSLLGCGQNSDLSHKNGNLFDIALIKRYTLTVPEPSGLSLSADSSFLWTVSDQNGKVYALDFVGRALSSFAVKADNLDLEGVCADPDGKHLWLVNERVRELIRCDLDGNILIKKKLLSGDDNSGLEGIAYNAADSILYILKEKEPGILLILNNELETVRILSLDFAADYSGAAWSEKYQALWIISDESKSLSLFSPDSGILGTVNFSLDQAEGVAVDERNQKLWLVSDSRAELLSYSIDW
ncbi:MAG TPA: hypothetical protein ENN84_11500 [Candidatus Marinimicrobia bacterium]|nr:hypothetical protein [Candidatus Neomarinimicrobiota bacterium]